MGDTSLAGFGNTFGVFAAGLYGVSGGGEGPNGYGVIGENTGGGVGVYGHSPNYAGFFLGNVGIQGALFQSSASFKIDHPLDPANQYLYHAGVESSDMKNVYDGVVTLDAQGEATVELPKWFEALNKDFRYQLTPLGAASPNLYIAQKVQHNQFTIAGGLPQQEISWQVTGIRQDEWAKAHPNPVEEAKSGEEKGKYLHPELFGELSTKVALPIPPRPPTPAKPNSTKGTSRTTG